MPKWIKFDRRYHNFVPGMLVLYVPLHAYGDTSHKHCEVGKFCSLSRDGNTVFVQYNLHPIGTNIEDIYIQSTE